jgi:hypothetical protein
VFLSHQFVFHVINLFFSANSVGQLTFLSVLNQFFRKKDFKQILLLMSHFSQQQQNALCFQGGCYGEACMVALKTVFLV